MAALGKVSEGPPSSTDCRLLDLQVAVLQGCVNTLGPKSWWRSRESNPGLLLKMSFHVEFHLSGLSGSALKVVCGWKTKCLSLFGEMPELIW